MNKKLTKEQYNKLIRKRIIKGTPRRKDQKSRKVK